MPRIATITFNRTKARAALDAAADRGLSHTAIAARADVSAATLYSAVRGDRLSHRTAAAVARALGVSVAELVAGGPSIGARAPVAAAG